jgi:hypothetical protein
VTHIPEDVRDEFLADLAERYTPQSYSLLHNNCNNFSHELAQLLVGCGIPDHITGLPAEVGPTSVLLFSAAVCSTPFSFSIFRHELAQLLVGRSIPDHITRLPAEMGPALMAAVHIIPWGLGMRGRSCWWGVAFFDHITGLPGEVGVPLCCKARCNALES